ncbi:alpha/beta fold hydrolase [Mucilaginibacter sp. PAMB04274]|uniref:alpha/beta fold hydrolase n=1 Tax=Mucilaginibacter sp. PAMB04274 TaxID=3138568 RepID=UPI0031F717E6
MKKLILRVLFALIFCSGPTFAQKFSLNQVLSYPFPTELTSSEQGSKIAVAINEEGKRNVYVAEGPSFKLRKLTNYNTDDGQEISSLSISPDGNFVVFVRGGDHSSNEGSVPVNPAFDPAGTKVQVWSIAFAGGEAKALSEGDYPAISTKSNQVAFIKNSQVWIAPIDGSVPAKSLFTARGSSSSVKWSPDSEKLAFVSARTDHSFIGIYSGAGKPIQWIAPSFARDGQPRWSPDGTHMAFIRTPGTGSVPDSILARKHQPWAIWTADLNTGKATQVWKAPATLAGSMPTTDGGANLNWAAGNRIVFVSYHDGWPHLYSVPSTGGQPLLLTPGNFMVEQVMLSADGKSVLFSANKGTEKQDIDRRHIGRVAVDKAAMEMLTAGNGIEAYPVLTGDGNTIVYLSSTAQRPLVPAVMDVRKKKVALIGEELIPGNFPKQMVAPRQVVFKAPDGIEVHGQLFEPVGVKGKSPAIVYVHGGPQRQMVLGWHFMDYYSIDYALNQYLASMGFTVLSVNYRLGVGYGYEFHKPAQGGATGAIEYQDIKAAGDWLAAQPNIDAKRIGIYGGSYGGFLTAMALAKNSDRFAAGVDIHGVHNWVRTPATQSPEKAPDAEEALKVARQSSPVNWIDGWKSPVLFIHADDDRNVAYSQTVDLIRRFENKGMPYEFLAIPDDTHHWMKYSNAVTVSEATAEFLKRKLIK